MSEHKMTELQRLEVLRLSNAESNKITKTCIESALIILMKDKELHQISITDIVKRAGVSRTAYYRNYKSKEDILRSMIEEIANQVMEAMNLQFPITNTYAYWESLFTAISMHSEGLQILLKGNFGSSILDEIHKIIHRSLPQADVSEIYKYCFWSGAIYSVTARWIMDDMKQGVGEMAEICYSIMDTIDGANCLEVS